jgi:Apea-like HEPN
MYQNEQLNHACEAWLRAALAFLQTVPTHPYFQDFDIHVDVTPEIVGRYDTHLSGQKIDAERLVLNNSNELFTLPEYETLTDIILDAPELSSKLCPIMPDQPARERSEQRGMLTWYFSTFLTVYIKTKQDLVFSLSLYEYIYQKLEEYIYSTELIITTDIIQMRNLRCEFDKAAIGNNVFLRQTTYDEKKEALRGQTFLSLPAAPETVLEIHHRIFATAHLPVEEQMEVHNIANAVVLALRLIKPDFVEAGMYYHDVSDQPFRPPRGMGRSIFQNPFSAHPPYILTLNEIDALTALWPKAKKVYDKPELFMARTRFEGSYLRSRLDDMLIDFWIGLEALFLPQEFTRDMAQTVALAVSHYFGKTVESRNDIYSDIIKSHSLRSRVVHGKPVEEKNQRDSYENRRTA